jgi:hypothetical protein
VQICAMWASASLEGRNWKEKISCVTTERMQIIDYLKILKLSHEMKVALRIDRDSLLAVRLLRRWDY